MSATNSVEIGALVEVKFMELNGIIASERWVPGIIEKLTDQNVCVKFLKPFGEYEGGWYQLTDFGRTWR